MLTQRFCDRQRADSQKMPRLHFNSAEEFSASASPEHINASPSPPHPNADAELRERRAKEQLQRPRPQRTTHLDDLLNLATEQHEAVIEADKKGVLAWEEAEKAEALRKTEAEKAEALRKTEAAAAKEHTWAAVISIQELQRMKQAKDAQAASAGGLPPHLLPHP